MLNHRQDDYGAFRLTTVVTDPPWYENCFVVQHRPSGDQIVVDPGNNADRILEVLRANGGPVRGIYLTHGHPDHVGAVRDLQQELDLSCRAHKDEAPLLEIISDYARRRLGLEVEPPSSVDYIDEATELTLGGQPFRLIPTPGHTPGGVCYAFDDAFVLTGDTLFNHGIGRTDLPGGNAALLSASLTRLLETLPEGMEVHCGHGPGWTVGEARHWWGRMGAW